MPLRPFFILLVFIFSCQKLAAQPLLESRKIVDLPHTMPFVSSKGEIWLIRPGTGIFRFDGAVRQLPAVNRVLPNSVAEIFENTDGKLWYACSHQAQHPNRIGILENNTARPVAMPDSIERIYQDANGRLIFRKGGYGSSPIFYRNDNGSLEKICSLPATFGNQIISFLATGRPENTVWASVFSENSSQPSRFFIIKNQKIEEIKLPLPPQDLLGLYFEKILPDGSAILFCGKNQSFFDLHNGAAKPIFQSNKLATYAFSHNFSSKKPLFFVESADSEKPYFRQNLWKYENHQLLEIGRFSGISELYGKFQVDERGNFLIGSPGGVFKINPRVRVFEPDEKTPDQIWSVIEDAQGMYFFGSYLDGLVRFDGKKILPPPPKLQNFKKWMHGSIRLGDEIWMPLEQGKGIAVCKNGSNCDTVLNGEIAFLVKKCEKTGTLALGLANKGMAICPPARDPHRRENWHFVGERQGWKLVNTLGIAEDNFGRIWGCRLSTGLAVFDPARDTAHTWLRRDPQKDFGGFCLLTDSRGSIWFGTQRGLRFFEPKLDDFEPRRDLAPVAEAFFKNKIIRTMTLLGQDSLLVADAENRLVLIDLKKFYGQNFDDGGCLTYFPEIREIEGSAGQNSFFVDSKRQIWLPVETKLLQFRLENLLPADDREARLQLDSLTFSGGSRRVGEVERIELPHGIRHLEFHFSPEKYRPGLFDSIFLTIDNVQIFKGLQRDFRSQTFAFSQGGRHEIRLAAVRNQTILFEKKLEITLPYFFTEHPAFLPGVFLVVLSLLAAWFFNRQNFEKKLHAQEKLLARLRVGAMVNQLNPHFLKNSLHWMQTRVFRHDAEVADVISRLGRSLKIVVDASQTDGFARHALAEELQLVENYLKIQKSLFQERLDFEIVGAAAVIESNAKLLVPLMSLQIFVENAMVHGIENKSAGGKISVRLRDAGQNIKVEIEDDGVGFEAAARFAREKGKKNSGKGSAMIFELFEILNRQNPGQIHWQVEQKKHSDGSSAGVFVSISFPKK